MIIEHDVSLEELENFILFRIYYDRMMCLNVNQDIMKALNKIMDYHFDIVYGENYKSNSDIISHDFKCVYEIEKG